MTSSPLAATLARLNATTEHVHYVVGEPAGGGWHRYGAVLADEALVDAWHREILVGGAKGRRDVAGSYMASWLTGLVVESVVAALAAERRTWPLVAENLVVRRNEHGWLDGIAVMSHELRVLPTDPAADHPDARVRDTVDDLRRELVDEAVALVTPVFAAVRARSPFGTRGMWAGLADGIAEGLVFPAFERGADVAVAWDEASAVVDELVKRAPVPAVRPRLDHAEWSGGTASFVVKGTCCLFYKTLDGTPDPESDMDYCTSCPFRDDHWRRQRWAARLEDQGP